MPMRIFVAGATGVLGRALLPRLIEAGYSVVGLARSPDKLIQVDRMGAIAVRADILDADGLMRLLQEQKPDAVLNLATAIPLRLKIDPKDWEQNDRIRSDGTRNLLRAAEEIGAGLFVQESVGYVCSPQGNGWIDEDAPRSTHPFLRSTVAMEDQVRASRVPGVLLRFGALMSADSWHTQQSVAALKRGMLPIIGDGSAYLSMIHAEDAAQAIQRVLEAPNAAGGRTYNVVDNEPTPMRDVFPFAAQCLSAPTPKHVAPFLAKMLVGSLTLEILAASYRMTNATIKELLGFTPQYPSYRECWRQVVQAIAGKEFTPSDDLS